MVYTQGILERLNNPYLQDPENDGRKILDGTIGEYLSNYDNHLLDMFLIFAKGKYLDLHGNDFGIYRRDNESDTDYRNRILVEQTLVQSTSDFLKLDLMLWVYQTGVVDTKNTLTSRNPYLKDLHDTGYTFIGTGVDSEYLRNKFILEAILWV